MDKDILFQKLFLSKPLKTPEKTKPFFWILYQAVRISTLWGFIVMIPFTFKLWGFRPLEAQEVENLLRIFCPAAIMPCLLLIVPLFVAKAQKIIGFEGIDYTDLVFSRRGQLPKKEYKLRIRGISFLFYAISPFFWHKLICEQLAKYSVIERFDWVFFSILIFSCLICPVFSWVFVEIFMKRKMLIIQKLY